MKEDILRVSSAEDTISKSPGRLPDAKFLETSIMLHPFHKAACLLALLLPLPAMADYIHWEMQSEEDTPSYMGANFVLSGGFDFDLDAGVFSNITVRTSTTDGCVACNDFSDGGSGSLYSYESFNGVEFSESYGPDELSPGRTYWLQVGGTGFDVAMPGSHTNMDLTHWGHVLLFDPYGLDPDMYENIGCPECVTMIGTLVPAPEPETYVMLLAGLGVLGWHTRRKIRQPAST